MSGERVSVVGAGVIGLSVASELVAAGYRVTVIAELGPLDTVSAIAGALWMPHESERSAAATRLLELSLDRFIELAGDDSTGILLREGTVIERGTDPDRSWIPIAKNVRSLPAEALPEGASEAYRATLPLIHMPTYLGWLEARLIAAGVAFETREIDDIDGLAGSADAVVVAAGLRGGELLGDDDSVYPVRGQVVRVANPGLTHWITDDENPAGITYVFPRYEDVVVGGTGDAGEWDTRVDADTEAALLERAIALVPALAGQAILSRAVGLRPVRPTIRLERVQDRAVPTIAAYGHGGAGVTLSWGTAQRVCDLVDDVFRGTAIP